MLVWRLVDIKGNTRTCPLKKKKKIYIYINSTYTYIHIPYVYSGLSIPWGCSKPQCLGFTINVQLYYQLKWDQKRWEFRLLLNEINVFDCLISWGRAFRVGTAADQKLGFQKPTPFPGW